MTFPTLSSSCSPLKRPRVCHLMKSESDCVSCSLKRHAFLGAFHFCPFLPHLSLSLFIERFLSVKGSRENGAKDEGNRAAECQGGPSESR